MRIINFLRLLVIAGVMTLLSACGTTKHSTEIYQASGGAAQGTAQVSSIFMANKGSTRDYVDWISVKGKKIKHKNYGVIVAEPGLYAISWGRKFKISTFLKLSGSEKRIWKAQINLEAGHRYTIHAERTVGHGYKISSWITDDTKYTKVWSSWSE